MQAFYNTELLIAGLFKPGKRFMTKGLIYLMVTAALCTGSAHLSHAQSYAPEPPFLKVNGTHISNGTDPDFIIRGIGLGGYMLQEGYMFHLSFLGTQSKIRAKIQEMAGPSKTEQFYRDWRRYFIQQADIDSIAAWGFNAIRLPLHYNLFTLPIQKEPVKGQNTWLPEGFQRVDSLLSWCSKAHIYLILDLHAAPGGQGNDLPISDRDPALPSLWQSKDNQDKTVALWEQLASRYKDAPYIGGYDLLNETNWGFTDSTDIRGTRDSSNALLWQFLNRLTKAVRKQDPRHLIILEGNGFANNYHGLLKIDDPNTLLSFHKYGNFNDRKSIAYFLWGIKQNSKRERVVKCAKMPINSRL